MYTMNIECNGESVNYKFETNGEGCRHGGFNHYCTLYRNGVQVASSKIHYINRTWEVFRFQSVMSNCIWQAINDARKECKSEYLALKGYKRLKSKEEFEEWVRVETPIGRELDALYQKFREIRL